MANRSEALKEVYASAPVDALLFQTIEINHPDFIDQAGNHAAIRIVKGYSDLNAKLESDAPMNPGELVIFTSMQIEIELAGLGDGETPVVQLTIDNVSREMMRFLEQAQSSPKNATIIYREYLQSDLSGPQMDPPLELEVVNSNVDIFQCVISCSAGNMQNFAFPSQQYTAQRFPGLNR